MLEGIVLMLARMLLPPAALGVGAPGSVMRGMQLGWTPPPLVVSSDAVGILFSLFAWASGMSWWRPVRWLQLGHALRVGAYTPKLSAGAFAAQLLCVGPAWAAADAAHSALAAAGIPLLSGVLAHMPMPLLAPLLVWAAAPKHAQRQQLVYQPDAAASLANSWQARVAVLVLAFACSAASAPIAAEFAAMGCFPVPLRVLRIAFGSEAAAGFGVSALHAAASSGCSAMAVRALSPLTQGALNAADARGDTAAVLAAARGDADGLDALAEAGAFLTALAPRGATPLHAAAAGDHVAAAEAVLQRVPSAVLSRDAAGDTPLASAVRAGAAAAAQLLLAHGADASPAALGPAKIGERAASLLVLALPQPALLDALVRARCASLASAASPILAAAQLHDELSQAKSELRLHSPLLLAAAARALAHLRDGATRCDDDDDGSSPRAA
jgi:hypothetical protein